MYFRGSVKQYANRTFQDRGELNNFLIEGGVKLKEGHKEIDTKPFHNPGTDNVAGQGEWQWPDEDFTFELL